jgi:ribose transport system substrate-binding protein
VKVLRYTAALVVAALILSACGSSSSSSSTPSSSGSSSTATSSSSGSSTSASVPKAPTTPPTTIQVTTALPKTPPAGKKLIALICQLPSCSRYEAGIKAAAAALKWSVQFMTLNNSNPAASLTQAVSQKPDYVFLSGIPASVLKAPLASAHSAGIPVISAADPDPASASGYAAQIGGTLVPDAQNVAHWIISDSGGKASVVAMSIPQFPVLVGETDWFKKNFTTQCPGCKYNELEVTTADVGAGKTPSLLSAYLQSHQGTNYVFFTFADLAVTVPPVLKSSGFSAVKLTGCCGDATLGKQISEGKQQAWTIAPNEYSGYTAVDAMARLSVGMKLTTTYLNSIFPSPSWVVDSPASANQYLKPTGFDWFGPTGYEQQYQKLWQAG